ncbi:MAG: hypothetical protein KF767_06600 [Bdellovibrionaceae bacterium]|nr:hypothetical protein [Pseudobdellovibrionaceae bacterium]
MAQQLPKSEIKARNADEAAREMLPFAIYAAIPIIVTIIVAFSLGSTT